MDMDVTPLAISQRHRAWAEFSAQSRALLMLVVLWWASALERGECLELEARSGLWLAALSLDKLEAGTLLNRENGRTWRTSAWSFEISDEWREIMRADPLVSLACP
jgi:hypothetical protein